jgi:hypothetical protein
LLVKPEQSTGPDSGNSTAEPHVSEVVILPAALPAELDEAIEEAESPVQSLPRTFSS